ncbi:uncharacterized protein ISCGN_025050 [Ixodes scapularis]
MALGKVWPLLLWAVACRAKGVPYSVEVLNYSGVVSERVARIWDGDDHTCFSVLSELNRTRASVRLFLNRSAPVALSRVVASPQPNVVYYLLEDKNDTVRKPQLDIWKGNIWNYRGEFSARVHAVDIHSVEELCEVTIFAVREDAGWHSSMAMEHKSSSTEMSPWKLVLYATLPVAVLVVVLALLYFRRSGPRGATWPSRRRRDASADDHEAARNGDDRTALFHNQLYVSADWDRPQPRPDDDRSDALGDPTADPYSDVDWVNRMLETSCEPVEIGRRGAVEPL